MEENSVINESAPATVFEFAPEEDSVEVVDAPQEEVAEADSKEETAPVEEKVKESEDSASGDNSFKGQKDIGKAFANESKRLERKFAKERDADPLRKIGKMFVDDLMSTEGLSEEDAIKKVNSNAIEAFAKRDNVSPNIAKKLYQQESVPQTEEDRVQELVDEFVALDKPQGWKDEFYGDPELAELIKEYSPKAALRIYMADKKAQNAPQDIAEKLKARAGVPQSMKPQSTATPKVDWTKVDTKDFLAEKERRRKFR